MRPIKKHDKFYFIMKDGLFTNRPLQFTVGIWTFGVSIITNLGIFRSACGFDFPFVIRCFGGIEKNLFCKTKKLSNKNKLEIQLYFKDSLNTGLSMCYKAPNLQSGIRSYISISCFGVCLYIAKIYKI